MRENWRKRLGTRRRKHHVLLRPVNVLPVVLQQVADVVVRLRVELDGEVVLCLGGVDMPTLPRRQALPIELNRRRGPAGFDTDRHRYTDTDTGIEEIRHTKGFPPLR